MKPSAEHELFCDSVRAFVNAEITPHVSAWDEAQARPRLPQYGGTPADTWFRLIATEEIARAGSGGLMASLFSHNIGLPPIVAHRSEVLKQRVIPAALSGDRIAALAITSRTSACTAA